MQASQQQANRQEQRSEPNGGEAERPKKPTKYSDVPAKGEFNDNHSNELVADQERRVVRESRYKNAFPEITDPGNSPNATEPGEDSVLTINDYVGPLDPFPVAPSAALS